MAVKIRLTRKGKKKQPSYRVVVADSRSPRDGRYIEQIGRYDPRQEPSVVVIDNDRAHYWLERGAQPSDAVRKLLEISGALAARAAKPVTDERIHVVGEEAQREAAEEEVELATAATEEVIEELAEEPVEPAEEPTEESAEEPTEEPVESAGEPAEEPAEPAEEPAAPVKEATAEAADEDDTEDENEEKS